MKVRAEAVNGRRVACPTCGSPVAVQVPGSAQSPEFRAAMPQDSDRTVAQPSRLRPAGDSLHKEEFAPTLAGRTSEEREAAMPYDDTFLRNLKSTDDFQSGEHVKVKKRRRQGASGTRDVLTDWDTTLETLPEAELYSDPWTESVPIPEEVIKERTRDFVVSEHREDGNTVRRVKRVRKRRLFTWAQLFFRRLSFGMRVFTIAIVTAIAFGGFAYGVMVFRQHFVPVTFDDVVAESRPGREFITSQDESSAADAVAKFLAVTGAEGKLPLVRLPARVQPLMEDWYRRFPDRAATIGEVRTRSKVVAEGLFFVIVELDVIEPGPDGIKRTRSFAVEETEREDGGRDYKVDWETAVEWRPMSFEEFKQTQPRHNVAFRVKIRGSSYYNHAFADESKWLAAEVYYPYPDRNEFLFHGYLERGTAVFNDLALWTGSGCNAAVIVNVRYPKDAVSRDQVILDSLVHDSWFYTENKPPEPSPDSPK